MKTILLSLVMMTSTFAFDLPARPMDPQHPSSPSRSSFEEIKINHIRRGSVLLLPTGREEKVPLLVFAHGQALNLKHYRILLEHFARKGAAVLYPKYDRGFFDTDWDRMGEDYARLTNFVLNDFPEIDKSRVVYSGHSKGGYVGLSALNKGLNPLAAIFFSPAGVNENALREMNPSVPLSIIYPEDDRIIKEEIIFDILKLAASNNKQLIKVAQYPDFSPGHFFLLTEKSLFGGRDGLNAYHFYGVIPWLFGALYQNDFLYGDIALDSGAQGIFHERVLYP